MAAQKDKLLDKLYSVSDELVFLKTVYRGKTHPKYVKLLKRFNILKKECNDMNISYDHTKLHDYEQTPVTHE